MSGRFAGLTQKARASLEKFKETAKSFSNSNGSIIAKAAGLAPNEPSFKSMLETSRHFDIMKSSFEKFKDSAYTKLAPSINNFSLVYDQITGRESVRNAGVELLQVNMP